MAVSPLKVKATFSEGQLREIAQEAIKQTLMAVRKVALDLRENSNTIDANKLFDKLLELEGVEPPTEVINIHFDKVADRWSIRGDGSEFVYETSTDGSAEEHDRLVYKYGGYKYMLLEENK